LVTRALGLLGLCFFTQSIILPLNVHSMLTSYQTNRTRAAKHFLKLEKINDILWAHERWMPMEFPNGLHLGSSDGHGSIRYDIESYTKGQIITFRFTAPKGFDGWHKLSLSTTLKCFRVFFLKHFRLKGVRARPCPLGACIWSRQRISR
jgi:hypothetical protein